jgi:hypothetical protein
MRDRLAMVRSLILLLSILFPVATAIAGCSSSRDREVEMTAPRHASTLIAERGEMSWDIVALGDSAPAGVGVGSHHSYVQVYAGYVEQDLGVIVNVHNYATGSIRKVADWVQEARNNENLSTTCELKSSRCGWGRMTSWARLAMAEVAANRTGFTSTNRVTS